MKHKLIRKYTLKENRNSEQLSSLLPPHRTVSFLDLATNWKPKAFQTSLERRPSLDSLVQYKCDRETVIINRHILDKMDSMCSMDSSSDLECTDCQSDEHIVQLLDNDLNRDMRCQDYVSAGDVIQLDDTTLIDIQSGTVH